MKSVVYNSIAEVPKEAWDKLASRLSITQTYDFWTIVELAELNDFDHRYAIFYDAHDEPQMAVAFYSITTDIAIFAPAPLRLLLSGIRKFWPEFLKAKMLECGTPITLTSPALMTAEGVEIGTAVDNVVNLLMQIGKKEKHFIIVVRDFEPNAVDYEPHFARNRFHLVDSLPNMCMPIRWKTREGYVKAMKSYYRSKVVKHMKRNEEAKVRHEVVDDFAVLADTLCAQWMVVHNQADEFQREVLSPKFYREFSEKLGDKSKVILFYRDEWLVGHALLLVDGDMLRWLYFGREEAVNDSLYIYVGQAVIETAIKLGVKKLEMGLTTYQVKLDMGAEITPIKLALRAPSPSINRFVGKVYPWMNRPPKLKPRDVFRVADPNPKKNGAPKKPVDPNAPQKPPKPKAPPQAPVAKAEAEK
ncbi:GNAT family N-acetyltransferase [Oryzibacter oryziterrae]|uniref:GNAT family N-acetyltransferase n=1 Tax=Oryzibacter oryziterrae TaxID=2766474 RepID=UPI001F24799B|nr:GNAT family N-acetyltransferase [Oryzibacter oryziterrae]